MTRAVVSCVHAGRRARKHKKPQNKAQTQRGEVGGWTAHGPRTEEGPKEQENKQHRARRQRKPEFGKEQPVQLARKSLLGSR